MCECCLWSGATLDLEIYELARMPVYECAGISPHIFFGHGRRLRSGHFWRCSEERVRSMASRRWERARWRPRRSKPNFPRGLYDEVSSKTCYFFLGRLQQRLGEGAGSVSRFLGAARFASSLAGSCLAHVPLKEASGNANSAIGGGERGMLFTTVGFLRAESFGRAEGNFSGDKALREAGAISWGEASFKNPFCHLESSAVRWLAARVSQVKVRRK